ncbi:aldo/keto reductase [Prevotella sp. 10(H)]|uniref:aldo/keto reductase n=1 Tax=Prevotella sp. 10(H) TaxID=1158294 RepID=UPI0004A76B7D|nr:aldo/keto reductase [Prevotella sp. 10(H)]
MDRRKFIKKGMAGITLIGTGMLNINCSSPHDEQDNGNNNGNGNGGNNNGDNGDNETVRLNSKVQLGETGLTVPLLAMGTGTVGWGGSSNQTRMGMEQFVSLAHNAYERGMRFYDMAEAYGSHRFVAEAIKDMPREELTLLTKITSSSGLSERDTRNRIDHFRREVGTEYFDIILMHYMTSGGWANSRQGAMEGLARAKEEGIIKAVGISAHSLDALRDAAESPWVDVILARINPFQSHMDGSPDTIKEVLATACRNGKGVIGMKIFGEGSRVRDEEREQSLRFALTESNIHCMTIGFETLGQMNDAIARVTRIQKELNI